MAKLVVLSSFTVKYKLPSALFSSHVRLNNLWSALEGFPAEGLEVPEACGLHPSPEVSQSTSCHTYIYSCFEKGCPTKPYPIMPKGIMGNGGL